MAEDRFRQIKYGLLISLAYVVTGKLSLLLALPPGYVSPIFPPAGIAVAAAFIGGRRLLPWILLGSEILNLWTGYSPDRAFTSTGIAAATIIAIASTLQAAIGGWVLRRFIGYPSHLDSVRDVVILFLLAPVICLVSSTLSVAGLTLLGTLDIQSMAGNWFTWWIGDSLGVIVSIPIVLALAGEPREQWRRRAAAIVIPMLLAFSLGVFVFLQTNEWVEDEVMTVFEHRAQQVAEKIQANFDEQEFLLQNVVGFLSHDLDKPVSRIEFQRAVRDSLERFPVVQAVEWAPRIGREQRSEFEAAQQTAFPGFRIKEREPNGRLQSASDRPYYYPVTFLEPVEHNRAAIGLDLASTPARWSALSSTLVLGIPVATAPVRLVQETEHQTGILLMLAVSEGGNAPGVALTVLRSTDFINSVLQRERTIFNIKLTDIASSETIHGRLDKTLPGKVLTQTVKFGTRQYRLQLQPTPLYLKQLYGWQSWMFLVVELLGTGLLGAFLLLGTGYTARVETKVLERTRSLKSSRDELKRAQRIAMLGSWVLDLQNNALSWSDEIFRIFETDPDNNEPSYELFLKAIHPEDREMVDRAYRESVEKHLPYEIMHRLLFTDGRIKYVRERGETYYDEAGEPLLSRGTVQDITRIMEAEEALRTSEERWKFALEGAGDGVWDWNLQTGELFLSQQEMTVLGYDGEPATNTHIDEWVLRQHPQDRLIRQRALERYLSGEAPLYICEFRTRARDGDWKWVLARGMLVSRDADGKPLRMIGTHSDITERKKMEADLMELATTDPLTGVANRRHFLEQVEMELSRFKRHGTPAALLMLDIDYFKRVNDVYGHAAGDAVLIHFSRQACMRLRHTDLFGRLGGEEFGVLLPSTDIEGAQEFAEQIRQNIADNPIDSDKGPITITVSIGVAEFSPSDEAPDSILARADAALYRAKQGGRNRCAVGYAQSG